MGDEVMFTVHQSTATRSGNHLPIMVDLFKDGRLLAWCTGDIWPSTSSCHSVTAPGGQVTNDMAVTALLMGFH